MKVSYHQYHDAKWFNFSYSDITSLFQNYTQYIPLSIYDLQTWMGSPSIFVYDCSNAGIIVKSFKQFALQREQELEVSSCTHGLRYATTKQP